MKTDQYKELLERTKRNTDGSASAAATWWLGVVMDDEAYVGDSSDMSNPPKPHKDLPSELPSVGLMMFAGAMITSLELAFINGKNSVKLVVDTSPDDFLKDCARQAGIEPDRFNWPLNTRMRVTPHRVLLECGRARLKVLWTDEA